MLKVTKKITIVVSDWTLVSIQLEFLRMISFHLSSQGWKTTVVINKDCEGNIREVTNTFAMNFFPSKPQGELNSFARALEMSLADCFALF